MASEASQELKDLRIKALQIALQCEQDDEYKKQLTENPRATLEAAGIPSERVNDVIGQELPGTKCFVSCVLTDTTTRLICVCCNSGPC
ncbi:MAG: hypothetical protein QNJ65_11535 [Xenococcaceae cyanobacterium MO_234.B1]|nr:hypothetical protein [Xenococcaceae cyanobacterium MO_234.B1]